MANIDIAVINAAAYQSPYLDDHKRRVLRLYALLIGYQITQDFYTTAANLALLFSTAKALFSAVPDLNNPCSPNELAIWFEYARFASAGPATASMTAKLLVCAPWMNQTDRALDEATLYLLGRTLAALT